MVVKSKQLLIILFLILLSLTPLLFFSSLKLVGRRRAPSGFGSKYSATKTSGDATNRTFPVCYKDFRLQSNKYFSKTIYFISQVPPHQAESLAILTRLEQTLRLVPNLVWVLVQDQATKRVSKFLERSCVHSEHIDNERGELIANVGLKWIIANVLDTSGVVYFGDSNDAFDLQLFVYMRQIKKVGIWPVAFYRKHLVQRPIVKHGHIVEWDSRQPNKQFRFDFAAFAVTVEQIAQHSHGLVIAEKCFTCFFQKLSIQQDDLEVLALKESGPNRILVWKTLTWSYHNDDKKGSDAGFVI